MSDGIADIQHMAQHLRGCNPGGSFRCTAFSSTESLIYLTSKLALYANTLRRCRPWNLQSRPQQRTLTLMKRLCGRGIKWRSVIGLKFSTNGVDGSAASSEYPLVRRCPLAI